MLTETKRTDLFCEYYAKWITVYKKGAIRKVTMDKYLMTQKWLVKLVPNLRVCDMNRIAYQQLLNDYAEFHERQTTMDFHHQLKGAILDAVDEGLIERDPTRKAIIKGKPPVAKKIKYLNQFELHTLLISLDLKDKVNWDYFILLVAKTGMRFSEALALTPKDFDFAHQTLSISKTSPEKVANDIRETIKFELGLTISVGVSFNKIFAKLGSDMKKPDAVTVIPKDTFRDKIWGLPAADLLGVGRATQRVLDSYCIRTIGDLAKTDPDFLNRRLGKNGIALWQYANGNDRSRVMNADFVSPVKSVGHGITTIEDLENDEQVWPVFLELTQDIGHKLRVHKKCADGVAIHIRDNTLFSKQWQTALDMPTQSPMLIAKAAFALFEKRYDWRNPIRSVTIQAINLVPQDTPRQVDLFMNIEKIEKAERLDQCIETIRQRFGKNSIRNGILFQNLRMPSEKPEITMPTGVLC